MKTILYTHLSHLMLVTFNSHRRMSFDNSFLGKTGLGWYRFISTGFLKYITDPQFKTLYQNEKTERNS
jgi:hypothetical protein